MEARKIDEELGMRQFLFVSLWLLLPLQGLGANLVIPTELASVDIPDVKFYRLTYGFHKVGPEGFQVQVILSYRPWTSHLEHVQHLTFRLASGTIAQRDDQTLVLQIENREVVVGRHHWWYSPAWQTARDVHIACDRATRFRRVTLKNCRLIVGKSILQE
jgi:hypothetical protein